MLLLLPFLNADCAKLPAEVSCYFIDDLFEVSLGLVENRYGSRTTSGVEPVHFVRLSSFEEVPYYESDIALRAYDQYNLFDFSKLSDGKGSVIERRSIRLKKQGDRNYIPDKKLLTDKDYLISVRGIPKGFSLARTFARGYAPLVANHHFIVLRPRKITADMHLPYLHIVLDLIVLRDLRRSFLQKKMDYAKSNRNYSAFNALRVDDFRKREVFIPKDALNQEKVHALMMKNYQEVHSAMLHYDGWLDCLYGSISGEKSGNNTRGSR